MIYLLTGNNTFAKDEYINRIKAKWLTSKDALEFDFHKLDGHKLDPAELKKSLIELPAVASKRVVLLRTVEKLSTQNKDMITDFSKDLPDQLVLILDAFSADMRSAFFKSIKSYSEHEDFSEGVSQSVFDMTNAMSARNPKEALRILTELTKEGNHPLQIMGTLVWFWGKMRNRLKGEQFKKGLLELQEADLNIKRSRMPAQYALETVVVKLCLLISG